MMTISVLQYLTKYRLHACVFAWLLILQLGCDSNPQPVRMAPQATESEVAISGLTVEQEADFEEGRFLFQKSFDLEDGLGPFFAEDNCAACHQQSGRGPGKVLRIGRTTNGIFDPMLSLGGPTIQFRSAIRGVLPESVPPEAQFVNFRVSPAIFGRGYIEAIPEESILALADPNDANGDGISGRPNIVVRTFVAAPTNPVLGRLGLKAQIAEVDDFVSNAFLHDLGMTTHMRPNELINPHAPKTKDKEKGIDVSVNVVDKIAAFIRMSDFPAMLAETPDIATGKALFAQVGCTTCHVPSMTTGTSDLAGLSNQTVFFYSDFLIHDMGPGLSDGALDFNAQPFEWKTPVLRGMRFMAEFLHDGRAGTIHDAIVLHGGEAQTVIDNYLNLSQSDRQRIVDFVHSL